MMAWTKEDRIETESTNNQGCQMKIIEYNNSDDIVVEFQDEHMAKVHTKYSHFLSGGVKNPYYPVVYGVGASGNKYPTSKNGKRIKEHNSWNGILTRCFDKKTKEKYPTYKDTTCCDEWLLYDNFYEWLHSQENFDKWLNGSRWAVDKDILVKGNKIYSPETCCLVPMNINSFFSSHGNKLYDMPAGIDMVKGKFLVRCCNPITNNRERLGLYKTLEEAFCVYKQRKEDIIKQLAQKEFDSGNITKECYNAMMNYEVEITD